MPAPLEVFLIIMVGLVSPAFAQETHNFYFQKTQAKVEKSKPAIQKIKVKEEIKKEESGFTKKWEASAGVGVFTVSDTGQIGRGTRDAYVFGGRYFFNEFFDLNSEMLYPRANRTSYYGGREQTHGPLFKIGAGTTPIHFTFLGYPFWEWGFDAGMLLGSDRYLDGENALLFVGHRQSINFSRSWSLTYNLNFEISGLSSSRAYTAGLKLAYRW